MLKNAEVKAFKKCKKHQQLEISMKLKTQLLKSCLVVVHSATFLRLISLLHSLYRCN